MLGEKMPEEDETITFTGIQAEQRKITAVCFFITQSAVSLWTRRSWQNYAIL